MDFGRLVSGQDPNLTRNLAEQLLSNAAFRDAAIKAAAEDSESGDATQSQTQTAEISSGLDNLLNQLTTALTQASAAAEASPETLGNAGPGLESVFSHPLIKQALASVPAELALGVKVALGQIPPQMAEAAVQLLNSIPASTVSKVESVINGLGEEELEKGIKFFQALFGQKDDRVYAQQDNRDNYLTSSNAQLVSGADLNSFLQTAYYVLSSGYDAGKFLDDATNVLNKGDYDDFRRFLSVTDMVMYRGDDLDTFFDFGNKMLDEAPDDYEGNLFQIYTTLAYGGNVNDYVDIADNLQVTGQDGRNNLVDMTRITVDFYKNGGYTPALFDMLATESREGGNVRELMDMYMSDRKMAHTGPDFTKFDRIERIDGPTMVIKQGESAALFAQAVSSRDGLLPESVLFWSSLESGAMSHGSSYLDLSKLPPGTYNIGVKIGNYAGGTDTAFKTVIVEPNPDYVPPTENPEIIVPVDSQVKITVQSGAASLRSDLYMKKNGEDPELVAENAQQGVGTTLEKTYKAGDKLDFLIRTLHPQGAYDHGTDVGMSLDGRNYVKVEQLSDTSWKLYFEDLEADQADWDYDDVVVIVELLQVAQDTDAALEETAVEEVTTVVGGGTTAPASMSKEEAVQITRDAIASLASGSSTTVVASTLNERYYQALDEQIESNNNYARMVDNARIGPDKLKAVLQGVLQSLTGEAPPASTNSQLPFYYNPYF